jgi:tight adherence protein B
VRTALFDTAWGVVAVALAVGSLTLVATLVVLSRPRGAWVRGRLEPYTGLGTTTLDDEDGGSGWRPDLDRMHGATTRLLSGTRVWRSLERRIERAAVNATPAELMFWSLVLGLGAAIVVALIGGGIAFSLLLGVGALLTPTLWLSVKAQRRLADFEEQLPDVLMTMAGSLKVGQSFNNSMRAIVDEGLSPASDEFGRVLAEARIGRPMDEALEAMADRIGSDDLRFVLMSVNIQREVGGSLSDFFHTVAETVRQRQQFRRRVKALTAMGRSSAMLLLLLPFATAALIALVGDGYLTPLFTTSLGHTMIVVMLILMVFGTLILRKIVDIKG